MNGLIPIKIIQQKYNCIRKTAFDDKIRKHEIAWDIIHSIRCILPKNDWKLKKRDNNRM